MRFLIVFACLVSLLSNHTQAQILSQNGQEQNVAISVELSTLLLDSRYQAVLAELKNSKKAGTELVLSQFSTLIIPGLSDQQPSDVMYAYLAVAIQKGQKVEQLGSIVGEYKINSRNKISYSAIFFKPAESGPGGGSVGN
jgi:hypothetical protein